MSDSPDPLRAHLARILDWEEAHVEYLRAILLVTDHNAYHLGQFVAVRRALGAWP